MNNSEKIEILLTKISLKKNKTPILLFFKVVLAAIIVDIAFLLIFYFVDFLQLNYSGFLRGFTYEEHYFILALVLHLFFFIYIFIFWITNFYIIKGGKVIHQTGIFFKKRDIFIISKINTIEIYQSFWGKIFDYGDISFFHDEKKSILKNIPNPEEFVYFMDLFKEE